MSRASRSAGEATSSIALTGAIRSGRARPADGSASRPEAASSPSKSSSERAAGSRASMNVDHARVHRDRPGRPSGGHRRRQVGEQLVDRRQRRGGHRQVDGGRRAGVGHLRLHVPPAHAHLVAHRERVQGGVARQRDQRRVRRHHHRQPGRHARHDPVHRLEDGGRQREVPRRPEVLHHRPRAGQRPARLGRLHRGVQHRVPRPVRRREELRPPQLGGPVHQHRGPLRRVAVLVGVHRDRRHPRHRERPRRHRPPEPRGVRQHPPADARVHVAADATRGREGGQRGDVVDDAVRVRRRGADHQHRRVVDGLGRGARRRPGTTRRPAPSGRRPRSSAPPCGTPRAPWTAPPSTGRRPTARRPAPACTASSTDSVPPEVTDPTADAGASSRSQANPTRSFSIASRLGNDVGSRPLDPAYAATASRPIRSTSGSPES